MKSRLKFKNMAVIFGAFLWLFASQIGILEQLSPSLHASVHSHFDASSAAHAHIPGHSHSDSDHHHDTHSHSDQEPDDHAHNPFFFTPISYVFSFDFSNQDLTEVFSQSAAVFLSVESSFAASEFCLSGLHPPPEGFGFQSKAELKKLPISPNAPPALV